MNKKTAVPAFTIVEAVVSMAITGIILSVIFVIFSITSERLFDFRRQNEHITDMNRMSYSINKGIFESEEMLFQDNILRFRDYKGTTVTYSIQEHYLIRQSAMFADTFKLAIKHMAMDTLKNKSESSIYQRLECSIADGETEINMKFYKKLYASQLITNIAKK